MKTITIKLITIVLIYLACLSASPRALSQTSSTGKVWAVVIGVSDYQYGIRGLPSPKLDAELFATAISLPEVQLVLLTTGNSDPARRPTKRNIMEAIRRVAAGAGPQDTLWIYFSGHGTAIEGKSYLVPEDARMDNLATLVSVSDIRQLLERSPQHNRARRKILVLDACCSGSTKNPNLKETTWEQILGDARGIITMAACQVDQAAIDLGNGSLFTLALLHGMTGGVSTNGNTTLESLRKYVCTVVEEISLERTGKPQTPIFIFHDPPQTTMSSMLPAISRNNLPPIQLQLAHATIREPLKPGLIVWIEEEQTDGQGNTVKDNRLQILMQELFIADSFPIVISEAIQAFQVTLSSPDEAVARKQIRQLNSRFLLRGKVTITCVPKRFEVQSQFETVTASVRVELVDAEGSTKQAVFLEETGNGNTEAAAARMALKKVSEKLHRRFEPILKKLLPVSK
jgi:hypothetical protein